MLQARGYAGQVRGRLIAGLGLLVVLLAAAPAQAQTDPLERYARRHVGVDGRDDRRAHGAARRLRGQGRHAQHADLPDQHRRLPVERGGGRAAGDHRPPRGGLAAHADDRDARDDGARQRRPVLQLVRHPRRLALADLARRRRRHAVAVVGRQRLARGRPADRGEPRARAAHARAGAVRLDGLRLLLPARRQPDPLPLRALDTDPPPCCYDTIVSESRIASYVGIEKGELPERQYYGPFRAFPDNCDWSWRDQAGRATRARTSASRCSRAPALRGDAGDAVVGRQHVRGADAGAVRARGALGRRAAGASTTRSRCDAQIHHGLREAGYGYWGFSPVQHARGRLRRLRRRRDRHGPDGNPSNEDTTLVDHGFAGLPRRASRSPTRRRRPTRTASSRRTPPSSPSATRRAHALANLAPARARLPAACTASGASATASTSTAAASRTPTSRSTRA